MTKPQVESQRSLQPSVSDSPSDSEDPQPVKKPEIPNGVPHSPPRDRTNSTNTMQPPPINESVTNSLRDSQQGGVSPDLIARITEQVLKEIESRKQPNTYIPSHFYPTTLPPNAPLSPTASVHSQQPVPRDVYTPPSPQRPSEVGPESPPRTNTGNVRSQSPHSQGSGGSRRASTNDPNSTRSAPATTPGSPEDSGETTLEKIWGKLFDDGKPTEKLGQLLRGMAEYMIDSYEPKKSLVVTPDKMQRYYRDTHISKEPYPWQTIFDDSVSCISRMYRELGCEHHLVQDPDDHYVKPDIPGLTPRGFQQWATMLVLAHPDEAFQRLRRIVRELPIDNPDLRNERFPKELPRRLFPLEPNIRIRDILVNAIEEHAKVSIQHPSPSDTPRQYPRAYPMPAPPVREQQAPQTPQPTPTPQQPETQRPPPEIHRQPPEDRRSSGEIQRPPSREQMSEAASVTSEASNMSSSVERERKPYGGNNLPPSCAIDDMNPTMNAPPIERLRKPYIAKEGEGRSFEMSHAATAPPPEDGRSPFPPLSRQISQPPPQHPPPPSDTSIRRVNSSSSRPINIPPTGPPRQRGEYAPPPPAASANFSANPRGYGHRASISSGRRRGYSPPPSAPFRASDGDVNNNHGHGHNMSASFENSHSWDGREGGRRYDHRDDGSLPPPSMSNRREHGRGPSPGRRASLYSDEDFYRPRRETTSGRGPG